MCDLLFRNRCKKKKRIGFNLLALSYLCTLIETKTYDHYLKFLVEQSLVVAITNRQQSITLTLTSM